MMNPSANGLLFPRAIGRQFRDRVWGLVGEGRPLRRRA
jgi:hypothetical protein